MNLNYKGLNFFFILLLLINLLGCSNKSEIEKNNSPTVPKSLLSISTISKNIGERLEQTYSKNKEAESKSESKQAGEEDKEKKGKKDQKDKEKQEKKEEELMNEIEKLFQSWNRYESKKKLPKEQTKKIEKKMNQLVIKVEKKELLPALFQLNQLNLEFARLYQQYYNKDLKSVLEKMKVYTRNIIYLSHDNKQNANRQNNNLKALENEMSELQRLKIEKNDQEKVRELANYISDLEDLIKEDNTKVIEMKGDLILNKINELK